LTQAILISTTKFYRMNDMDELKRDELLHLAYLDLL